MMKLPLLLTLLAFLAVGCTDNTTVETPGGTDVEAENPTPDTGIEVELDSLSDALQEGIDDTEDAVDRALDGDADGDSL